LRKRLDFGTGTFRDMGCHIYDPVFKALALTAPLSIRSDGPLPNDQSWATDAIIDYIFPGTAFTEGEKRCASCGTTATSVRRRKSRTPRNS